MAEGETRHAVSAYSFSFILLAAGAALSQLIYLPWVIDPTQIPRLLAITLVLAGVYISLASSQKSSFVRTDMIVLSLIAYSAWTGLSVSWSVCAAEGWMEWSRTIIFVLTFLAGVLLLRENNAAASWLLHRAVICAVTVVIAVSFWEMLAVGRVAKYAAYQVTGLTGHKNLLASLLFIAAYFILPALRDRDSGWRLFGKAVLLMSVAVLLYLRTKAVWGGAAVAAVIVFVPRLAKFAKGWKRFKVPFVVSVLVMMAVLNVFIYIILPRITSDHQGSFYRADQERALLWEKTLNMTRDRFLTGVGGGNWQVIFPREDLVGIYRAEDLGYTFQRPHNDLLWIMSETGFTGLNLFLLPVVMIALLLVRAADTRTGREEEGRDALMCLAFLCGYLFISFFDFPKERPGHLVFFGLLLAKGYRLAYREYPWRSRVVALESGQYFLVIVSIVLVLLVGLLRLKGEYYTRKVYDAQAARNTKDVVHFGTLATSFAYRIDGTSIPVRWYTGNARVLDNDMNGALADFRMAIEHAPYNRSVLNDLASAEVLAGDTVAGMRHYREALRISPRFDEPRLNMIAIYLSRRHNDSAQVSLDSLHFPSERGRRYQNLLYQRYAAEARRREKEAEREQKSGTAK